MYLDGYDFFRIGTTVLTLINATYIYITSCIRDFIPMVLKVIWNPRELILSFIILITIFL